VFVHFRRIGISNSALEEHEQTIELSLHDGTAAPLSDGSDELSVVRYAYLFERANADSALVVRTRGNTGVYGVDFTIRLG
jgi:hypothetical protein